MLTTTKTKIAVADAIETAQAWSKRPARSFAAKIDVAGKLVNVVFTEEDLFAEHPRLPKLFQALFKQYKHLDSGPQVAEIVRKNRLAWEDKPLAADGLLKRGERLLDIERMRFVGSDAVPAENGNVIVTARVGVELPGSTAASPVYSNIAPCTLVIPAAQLDAYFPGAIARLEQARGLGLDGDQERLAAFVLGKKTEPAPENTAEPSLG